MANEIIDYARRASTGLSWSNPIDRSFIANNLRAFRDMLLEEGESSLESAGTAEQLSRVQDRLVPCEMVLAREIRPCVPVKNAEMKGDR